MTPEQAPLVTSLGLVSNLGAGVVGAAAAQRAGLARRSPMPEYMTFESGDEMEAPVTGAPITGFTDGFMQPGLWLRLAAACLDDLTAYGLLPSAKDAAFWRRTGLTWVLPDIEFQRFLWAMPDIPAFLKQSCVQPLLDVTGLPISPDSVQILAGGSAAVVTATQDVAREFTRPSLDRMVVLATDSWLDPLSMRALINDNRIKSVEQPVGFCPGEAGAALLLERPHAANARGARPQARIRSATPVQSAPLPGADDDPHGVRTAGADELGKGLAIAIRGALTEAEAPEPFVGTIVLDLNGEEWRARAWGSAQSKLIGAVDFDRCNVIMPAVSFGDTGAASGILGICLGTRAFVRRYAIAPRCLVCSISEGGAAGAILIEAP